MAQGMQIAVLPIDPEHAPEKLNQIPKVSKRMKLAEGEVNSKAPEALAKFEEQIKEDGIVYRIYQEVPQGEWDRNGESKED